MSAKPIAAAGEPRAAAAPSVAFSPRAFLQARRPERFSDTVVVTKPKLPRTILEYQLSTLTNRSQETAFEHFARKLAERVVCPNLLPHTGPTGGGDSKVDAETYPVSDDLALAWFTGEGREAARERWAFAFSAMQDWKAKVKADIKSLSGTGRGYKKAFFISSQFIPDKKRAEAEDSLSKQYRLDVRIFDRTWILDRVFEGRHEQLAIDELDIDVGTQSETQLGPSDTGREQALNTTEASIERAAREQRLGPALVGDMIFAATLTRALGRPRSELEGQFSRAREAASSFGTPFQEIRIAYDEAFTAFFWLEDYPHFLVKLRAFDDLVRGTDNISHLEDAVTLWSALWTATTGGLIAEKDAQLETRTAQLLYDLDSVAKDRERPSAALDAEGFAIQVRMTQEGPSQAGKYLQLLVGVFQRSTGLLGFPMSVWIDLITELGAIFGNLPEYQTLHETVVSLAAERQGEVAAAQLLLTRGAQQLDRCNPYDAIRATGQALTRLHKEESRDELIRALYLIGVAYEQVGLLWAARGSLLCAATVASSDFFVYGQVKYRQMMCCNRLRWLELRLGRVPQALAWHEVTSALKGVLAHHGADVEALREDDQAFDGTFGILLMRVDPWELKRLEAFPDVLEEQHLAYASMTLKFLLGHVDEIPRGDDPIEAVDALFQELAVQPSADALPAQAQLYTTQLIALTSKVLGCEITAVTANSTPCLEVAESILAAFDSLMSTGLQLPQIAAAVPKLTLHLQPSQFEQSPLSFTARDERGLPHIDVRVGPWSAHTATKEQQLAFRKALPQLLAMMLAHAFMLGDVESTLAALLGHERAMDRAVNFTGSIATTAGVMGDHPKDSLSDWIEPKHRIYSLQRQSPWQPAPQKQSRSQSDTAASAPRIAPVNWHSAKHTDIHVDTLILPRLWDRAQWWGTLFITARDNEEPPSMALLFRDRVAAESIFEQWRATLSAHDAKDGLRLSIVRGITESNPHAYSVVIGPNIDSTGSADSPRFFSTMIRSCAMNPQSRDNLDRFLASYKVAQEFFILPALATPDTVDRPQTGWGLRIRKSVLNLMEAWEVGLQHMEAVALRNGDTPIIPPERQDDAPVLEVMQKIEQMERARATSLRRRGSASAQSVAKARNRFKKRKPKK